MDADQATFAKAIQESENQRTKLVVHNIRTHTSGSERVSAPVSKHSKPMRSLRARDVYVTPRQGLGNKMSMCGMEDGVPCVAMFSCFPFVLKALGWCWPLRRCCPRLSATCPWKAPHDLFADRRTMRSATTPWKVPKGRRWTFWSFSGFDSEGACAWLVLALQHFWKGMRVLTVFPDSPAEAAGLVPNKDLSLHLVCADTASERSNVEAAGLPPRNDRGDVQRYGCFAAI